MDASEFEFPPDQLDDDVAAGISAFPASAPSLSNAPFVYAPQSFPLSVLAQMPVDQLPPTQPSNPQKFSIGQVMRGALSTAHMRSSAGGSGGGNLPRPPTSISPLPFASYARSSDSRRHSPYLAAGHPPQRSVSSDEEERDGGAEAGVAQPTSDGDGERDGTHGFRETAIAVPPLSGRPARIDWSEGEVRSFYRALSEYGTDFGAIAVLFPRRSRSDIKRLYQREMRLKPTEVQQALNQKSPIDMKVFQERYEAKKKEAQVPVATKKLTVEELALVDEIESGMPVRASSTVNIGEAEAVLPPAALDAGEEATAAPTGAKPRKRKRDVVAADDAKEVAEAAKKTRREQPQHLDSGNETLFDMAMRHDREDNVPLGSLFGSLATPLDDTDFAFE
ncbi:hypothetical protein ABB37_04105 [Leptomonas pyrrhocoris]|uniref:Myb-like domain-containing protein n=1 Tax=Leptomonas pyrrhocoris TaxID=157538 RepID=A0A0N0DWI2_LEPPY|nr:hypothetical protein ABB37_04105 [Leptomonas pyrrhocoris]XP_015660288.1 hypothetical protein ABB37_04105 [Leptomonas pyrrhocoris]KPA81848.1 hypothetical protein ABB37_04105 [Leptomonas pyrrhocoris]KPA81849.1 hypothetical protein ABB37_04105 [Leptomonas pyrrhocoris]|eukprot:XP_015660287.1 hypothetical protein ABB37_04105 [Leptomonas pyrrhocoris]